MHSIEEIKTICRCGSKAMFNARFVDGQITISDAQVAVEGDNQSETYESMCGACYIAGLRVAGLPLPRGTGARAMAGA